MGGGKVKKPPTYQEVSAGKARTAFGAFIETARIVFDPDIITYDRLLRAFFEIHDPTQEDRQGPDVGVQYRSAVFYGDENQKKAVEELIYGDEMKHLLLENQDHLRTAQMQNQKNAIPRSAPKAPFHFAGAEIKTKIIDAKDHDFYPAEHYHQDYYKKTGKEPYCHYWDKGRQLYSDSFKKLQKNHKDKKKEEKKKASGKKGGREEL